jgi:hypothetical protein
MHVDAGHMQNDDMQDKPMDDETMEEILSCETITNTFYNENGMGGSGGDSRRQSILQAIFSPAFKLLKKMPYGKYRI